MTNLAIRNTRQVKPKPQSREMAVALANYRNRLKWERAGHHSISSRDAPTDSDVLALNERRSEIAAGLGAASDSDIDFILSTLFMGFGGARDSDVSLRQRIAVYRGVLRGLPAWAIRGACELWLGARAGAHTGFEPSAADLRKEADKLFHPLREELAVIDRILRAAVVREQTEAERAAVERGFAELQAEIGRPKGKDHWPLTEDEAKARLERLLREPMPESQLSPEALASLNHRKEDAA